MMITNKKYFSLAIMVVSLLVFSCKKTQAPNFHFDYFGNATGRYIIYDVVDKTHDQGVHTVLNYQLKTVWGENYIDNEGRACKKFRRYKKTNPLLDWVLQDTWYGLIDGIRGELVEENQRVVKLVFSPTSQKEWDANAYNMYPSLNCSYDDIHNSKSFGGMTFDSTVVVEQANSASLIDTIRKYEVYAKNIGLVYKYYKENDYQFNPDPQTGKELYYTFVSSGFE